VVAVLGGYFYMGGGAIRNNTVTCSNGGRAAGAVSLLASAVMLMEGDAVISGNTAQTSGDNATAVGGVWVNFQSYTNQTYNYNASFVMRGNASITGNAGVSDKGAAVGGVYDAAFVLYGGDIQGYKGSTGRLRMEGGSISGNTARAAQGFDATSGVYFSVTMNQQNAAGYAELFDTWAFWTMKNTVITGAADATASATPTVRYDYNPGSTDASQRYEKTLAGTVTGTAGLSQPPQGVY
jgi:hypothetical protein